ncbi:MAG: hypothetical protein ABIU63_02590 [Chitinophagaceae bacterium]
MFKRYVVAGIVFMVVFFPATGQNLSFTTPAVLLPEVKTDKAIDITNFNGVYFVTWKDAGSMGDVKFSCLGKQYDTAAINTTVTIAGQQTAYAPVFRVLDNRMYLFWISKDGGLKYIISNSENTFDTTNVYDVHFSKPVKLSQGVTAAPLKNKIVIATHADSKDQLLYCLLQPGNDGRFADTELLPMNNQKSAEYPFVATISTESVRFCWRGKDQWVYYSDYHTGNQQWTKASALGSSKTTAAPAIYQVWNADRLFYIWNGGKNDSKLYYASAKDDEKPAAGIALPPSFTTNYPVAICKVDDNNFLLSYTGTDNHLYLSKFSNYDPASWMQQVIDPLKSKRTLQDIVIPGAHDAGMSVLNGVGGQQSGTINSCNTLTQKLNIEQQLNAGIRMFDLRAGTYQKQLHAKHCASDCMQDAIGGGYGEKLRDVADGIRRFLQKNKQEIILVTFSHFCEKETPTAGLKDTLLTRIGKDLVFSNTAAAIGDVPLNQLAGKVIITFETTDNDDKYFGSCSIASESKAFVNFKREYAATNDIKLLLQKEKTFFTAAGQLRKNDLVRLDWQLTQSTDEAPMICNDFQDEKISPVVNGVMLLANVVRKHKSIIDHSLDGNRYLPATIDDWIKDGTITKKNKPHILYVDVAGAWITDYCIDLNKTALYQ